LGVTVAGGSVAGVAVAGVLVDGVDDGGTLAGVDEVLLDDAGDDVLVVVVRSELTTLPGNDFGLLKLPTSIPSVIAFMYLFQIVAGNVPPKTTRPWTLFMNRGAWPGALSYPIHTAVV
jgi:hypothetical protein